MADRPHRGAGGGRVDPARQVAFEVLRAVDEQDAYANLELSRLLRERGLTGRDAALATELVAGTLRGRGTYDAILDSLVQRELDPPVRDALRLGAHQLLATRVPDHAAIDTAVELVKRAVGHRPSGLVNAVLRKVARHDLDGWLRRLAPDPDVDPAGHRALATSHPRWIVDALAEALDRPEELDALLAADNARPAVHLVALPGRVAPESVGETGSLPGPYAVLLDGGDPAAVPAVRAGHARVQDAGSQLVAVALARAPLEGRDERWLDLCAGPGGKAALLAALASGAGARLTANEPAPHRARLVEQALAGFDAGVVVADGRDGPWDPDSFDRVLVDAPCSGLGALRRRPESRWRRTPDDVTTLVDLQRGLLDAALAAVRPGGVVAYATCSPVVAETVDVVAPVLRGGAVDLLDAPALVPEVGDARAALLPEALQLWPHRHGTDAMFTAVLRRR